MEESFSANTRKKIRTEVFLHCCSLHYRDTRSSPHLLSPTARGIRWVVLRPRLASGRGWGICPVDIFLCDRVARCPLRSNPKNSNLGTAACDINRRAHQLSQRAQHRPGLHCCLLAVRGWLSLPVCKKKGCVQ